MVKVENMKKKKGRPVPLLRAPFSPRLTQVQQAHAGRPVIHDRHEQPLGRRRRGRGRRRRRRSNSSSSSSPSFSQRCFKQRPCLHFPQARGGHVGADADRPRPQWGSQDVGGDGGGCCEMMREDEDGGRGRGRARFFISLSPPSPSTHIPRPAPHPARPSAWPSSPRAGRPSQPPGPKGRRQRRLLFPFPLPALMGGAGAGGGSGAGG